MGAEWKAADQQLIDLAQRVIREYRPQLVNARIGFLFRSESSTSKGRATIGKAQKVTAQMQVMLDLDFIIWVSKPDYDQLSPEGKKALLHHELCHCEIDTDTEECGIVGHDLEEFNAVIKVHGLWRADVQAMARAMQPHLPGLKTGDRGKVVAVDPTGIAESLTA